MPSLLDPIRLGAIEAPNRIFMAPLTRGRATHDHVPTPIMVDYYSQRASAGLIITEATGISKQGLGWLYARGIWSDRQVAAWQPITSAVHAAGGRIMSQLWHMGRVVHPTFLDGAQPISASATTAPSHAHTYEGRRPYTEARAIGLDEMPRLIDDYRTAARNAMAAGFDGVEIHAANGYLIDQFLRDSSNFRTDAYGGSVENRLRLLLQVSRAVADTVGPDRMGVRLSPNGDSQGVNDSTPEKLFVSAAEALSAIKIAFLELREPGFDGTFGKADHSPIAPAIRQAFRAPLILNSDYGPAKAAAVVASGAADAITFGRPFIANPDLPRRVRLALPLAKESSATWYSRGAEGYLDYSCAES
jgi:N-ethylmaleimide reductase